MVNCALNVMFESEKRMLLFETSIVEMKSDCEWIVLKLRCEWNWNGGCNWECGYSWLNQLDVLIMDWVNGEWLVVYWLFGCCWIVWVDNELDCLFVWFSW